VERAPVEGHVLTLEVFRVPDGAEWAKIESDCARGIWEAGDIKLVDRRGEPDLEGEPCFRMRWLNGLPLRWEGCGELYWPDQPRYRYFRVLGLQAARAIAGTDRGRSGYLACVVGKAGWYDEACTLASQAIKWGRGNPGRESSGEILADAMPGLPPDWPTPSMQCARRKPRATDSCSITRPSTWSRSVNTCPREAVVLHLFGV
jgi:hypothetical protein